MQGQTHTFLVCVSLHISVAVAFQPLVGHQLCGSFSTKKISHPTICLAALPPLQNLGEALVTKLTECLEQSYKDEPAFSAKLMETLGILGDTATATEVSLTEALLIRAEVAVTDVLGKDLENVGIDIVSDSRVDISLIERVGNLDLVLSCFELKAGLLGPRLLRDGRTLTFVELGGNECGQLSQQLSYSIKMTVPILRVFKGYGDAVTTAVISCKSKGKTMNFDSVRAMRFRIELP
eukprot:3088565-Rhodomonas_salina.1